MLAVAPDGRHVYTADVQPGTITELELSTGRRRSLPLAERINRISLSDDGATAYIADQVRPRLAVVDVDTMTLNRWLILPAIGFGTATMGPRGLIVALRRAGQLVHLDTESGHLMRSVRVPGGPQQVVVDSARRRADTTCSPADVVVAVDIDSMRVVAEVSPGMDPDGLDVSGVIS
jgi:DNA-binding beta-propeller fold protein YncE